MKCASVLTLLLSAAAGTQATRGGAVNHIVLPSHLEYDGFPEPEHLRESFHAFAKKYNRTYLNNPKEMAFRQKVYAENLRQASKLQAHDPEAVHGESPFSDLTREEFKNTYLNPVTAHLDTDQLAHACLENGASDPEKLLSPGEVPTEFDWQSKGAVTKVRNQGGCGSCWAFSTAENIEGQWFLAGHDLVELAPQELVDCSKGCSLEKFNGSKVKVCNSGCGGGWQWNAYMDVVAMGGIMPSSLYNYTGIADQCMFEKSEVAAKISNYTCLKSDEVKMANVLVNHGPLAIALDAQYLMTYQKGVINPAGGSSACSQTSLDHALLVVGYGVETNTTSGEEMNYWRVKNSWGTDWGEDGYFRIKRGANVCGVANAVSTSIV